MRRENPVSEQQVLDSFNGMDFSNDGLISKAEFKVFSDEDLKGIVKIQSLARGNQCRERMRRNRAQAPRGTLPARVGLNDQMFDGIERVTEVCVVCLCLCVSVCACVSKRSTYASMPCSVCQPINFPYLFNIPWNICMETA